MNYLAHAFLIQEPKEIMIGNIFGDFIRGTDLSMYPDQIQLGIQYHRKIDQFTDSHRLTKQSKKLFGSEFRTISAIMIDVFYDHFLAKNWTLYSNQALEDFSRFVYNELGKYDDILPKRLKKILPFMIQGDWLSSYREIMNVHQALNGLSGRLSRTNNLGIGVKALIDNYDQLESNFFIFFDDLKKFVSDF